MADPIFPKWIDRTRPLAGVLLAVVPVYLVGMAYYAGSPETTDVGYSPVQPVAYSHALHVGRDGHGLPLSATRRSRRPPLPPFRRPRSA